MDAVVARGRLKPRAELASTEVPLAQRSAGQAPQSSVLETLWRRRKLFAAVFASILALTAIALVVLPVRYRATGSVIFAEQEPGERDASPAWAQKLGDPADMESQLLVMSSSRMLRLAFTGEGVRDVVAQDCLGAAKGGRLSALFGTSSSTCAKLETNDDAMLEYLRTRFTIGNVGRSRVINVSYDSTQPEVARKLANALVNAFLDDQRASASASRQQAAKGIWDELARINAELRDDDTKIEEFRRKKGLERGSLAPVSSERLSAMLQQLSGAEAARTEAETRLKEILASRDGGSYDAPAALGSRTVADLKQQLAVVDVQLAAARSTLGPNHPTQKELERQHAMLASRVTGEVDALLAAARKRVDSTTALVAQLKKQVESAKSEAGDARADEASIEALVRGAEIKRRKYSELYSRASELETERRVLQGNARLVSLAELPDQPFFPKRVPFFAAGLTLASLLAAAAAMLRDRADMSLRSVGHLAPLARDEICVAFPRLSDGSPPPKSPSDAGDDMRRALQLAKRDDASQTALFELYTGLFASTAPGFRAICVTSSKAGEGKSFVAVALARFTAEMGRRVLLVECDQEKSDLAELFGVENEPGLLAVLSGQIAMRDAVVKTPIPRFYLLPIETSGEERRHRLGDRIGRLFEAAQGFDLMLLDCPPAAAFDTRLLTRETDGVLFCARAGSTSTQSVDAQLRALRAGGAMIAGIALTMTTPEEAPSLAFFKAKPSRTERQ